ncbi:MAG: EamA family transporter [Lentisphaeria bacterium]|nr:EamA family transporter [Lentisphaeria bacterium]
MFTQILPQWFIPILLSAFSLGFYDICKKHAVRDNSVMPVLFFATLSGSLFYIAISACLGALASSFICTLPQFLYVFLKTLIVSASWILGYYAVRELPISISAPIRASAPLWTFIGGLVLYSEIPTLFQAFAMLFIFAGYYAFSVLGKLEGFSLRHKGMLLIMGCTLLGAASALYDKYLLNVLQIPRGMLQLYFSIDLVFVLGAAFLIRKFCFKKGCGYEWRWSVPLTGILLIAADFLYFYAVSIPETHISILSLVRRSSCVLTFAIGAKYFRDQHVWKKAFALASILAGIIILALAK